MAQALWGTAKDRAELPVMVGPPNGPLAFRVSTTRHGVTGTNCNWAQTGVPAAIVTSRAFMNLRIIAILPFDIISPQSASVQAVIAAVLPSE
jgi:hypothetical protein